MIFRSLSSSSALGCWRTNGKADSLEDFLDENQCRAQRSWKSCTSGYQKTSQHTNESNCNWRTKNNGRNPQRPSIKIDIAKEESKSKSLPLRETRVGFAHFHLLHRSSNNLPCSALLHTCPTWCSTMVQGPDALVLLILPQKQANANPIIVPSVKSSLMVDFYLRGYWMMHCGPP